MTLKELRVSKKISQTKAAKFLNVPLRSYKRYENEEKYRETLKYKFLLLNLSKYKCESKKRNTKKSKIIVAGIGYVGLSASIVLSTKSQVTLVDINSEKVNLINKKLSPIKDKNFIEAVSTSNIKATTDIFAYKSADIAIIATPTDFDEGTKTLDTFSVESVVRTIREINRKCLIVIRSTVPIGFTDLMLEKYGGNIIFAPEFLRENYALQDAKKPSRIIFGIRKLNKSILEFQNLLESQIQNDEKVIYMSNKEAEATKLFSNAYLAMRVSFFNELDSYALKQGLNVKNIINGMGRDKRIGSVYNNPSFMFGGYCLPKDTKALNFEMENIENNQLINSIIMSNDSRLNFIIKEIIQNAEKISCKPIENITIGIYKLFTRKIGKDYRDSSSMKVLNELKKLKIKVIVFDDIYDGSEKDLKTFFEKSDLIVSNKYDTALKSVKNKLFTRDLI